MKRYIPAFFALFLFLLTACDSSPRSDRSFDEIRSLVPGKTASEIEAILGAPDSRESLRLGDERWLWWDYTYLGGEEHGTEVRGQTVDLQITFRNPGVDGPKPSYSEWRVRGAQDVSYLLPE